MSEPEKVVDQYRHLIGTEYTYTAPEEVGAPCIRQFALAIGDLNPFYINHATAAAGPYGGVIAPPTLVCETTSYYRGQINDEGGFTDRPSMPPGQSIRAGNAYVFHRPLRPTDIITACWKISHIYGKRGKSGALLFVQCHITYTNQHYERLAENTETLAYRLDASRPGKASPRQHVPTAVRSVDDVPEGTAIPPLTKAISTTQMMMYGAATWDFMRIHYDADYTRQRGFPGPFVDGQMLGAFLAQLVVDWAGDPGALKRLSVRYRNFVFPGDTVTCRGKVTHRSTREGLLTCELIAENQHGEVVAGPATALLTLPGKPA